jgi:hypothetical protein
MIKKTLCAALGFVAASAMWAQLALASTTSATPLWTNSTVTLRLGAFFPGTSGAKFFGGETQLTGGLDFKLGSKYGSNLGSTHAYFDYMGGAKNSGFVHSGGIGLDARAMTGTTYYGAGVGLYNTAVRFTDGTNGNRTGPGGKVFVGMGLGRNSTVQLDYHIMPPAMGLNPSGLGVEVGFHL